MTDPELQMKYAEIEREYQSKKFFPLYILIGIWALVVDAYLIRMLMEHS